VYVELNSAVGLCRARAEKDALRASEKMNQGRADDAHT